MFRALGTPGGSVWAGARRLPDYRAAFPRWPARAPRALLPAALRADAHACALFDAMLRYEPSERVAARAARAHPYLRDARLVPPRLTRAPDAAAASAPDTPRTPQTPD